MSSMNNIVTARQLRKAANVSDRVWRHLDKIGDVDKALEQAEWGGNVSTGEKEIWRADDFFKSAMALQES